MAVLRPAPGTTKWWVLGIVFTLAFGGWLFYREYSVAGERVMARLMAFDIVDARTASIRFEVTKPPEQAVVCTLQAQDVHHAVVGSAQVTVGPSPQRTTTQEATIRTTTPAVAALVHSCVRI